VSREPVEHNTRRNVFITMMGETKTIAEWCAALNMKDYLVRGRLKSGWPPEKAFGLTASASKG
jgi:hypothetical protein